MPEKLYIVESRILELMEKVTALSIKGVNTQREFCRIAGVRDAAISEIKAGNRGFTTRQIRNLADFFGVNLYWIFGLSESMYAQSPDSVDPIAYLKQAVAMVEAELKPATDKASSTKKAVVKKVVK